MSNDEAHVNEREYGELIATVKHLSGVVESLQQQYSTDTAKLHHRLDEMLRVAVTKAEHEKLADRVEKVQQFGSETRAIVDRLDGTTSMTRSVSRWVANAAVILSGAAAGALITAVMM